jgi:hypothetical protein
MDDGDTFPLDKLMQFLYFYPSTVQRFVAFNIILPETPKRRRSKKLVRARTLQANNWLLFGLSGAGFASRIARPHMLHNN